MLSRIYTSMLNGADGKIAVAEAYISRGLPGFHIVGLTDTVIKEAIERIRAAIINSGYRFPVSRITVNLAPADKKKNGSHYDLAMAMALLKASDENMIFDEKKFAFFGELALDGSVSAVPGILPLAMCAEENGIENILVPKDNLKEASFIKKSNVIGVKNLKQAVEVSCGGIKKIAKQNQAYKIIDGKRKKDKNDLDFSQVYGQETAKRAALIAASGGHDIMLVGVPGVGKTMIAKRFTGILPSMSYDEQREVTKLYSIAGLLDENNPVISERPFRMPHSSVTRTAMIGGGIKIRPGEISLAHKGVLFLDEVSGFDGKCLQFLRQPMEERKIRIVRNTESIVFPADFTLICAANPCKCGYFGDDEHICTCTPTQISNYWEKLSAPFLDRIDIHVRMSKTVYANISETKKGMDTKTMREIVKETRALQEERYKGESIKLNGRLDEELTKKYIILDKEAYEFLREACFKMALSMRGAKKVMRVARTIADMEKEENISEIHIAEALRYRNFETKKLKREN